MRNNISSFQKGIVSFIVVLAVLFLANYGNLNIFAEGSSFPTCESKIFTSSGDRAHYDSGVHGIIGVGNLTGKDDVYSLSNGDFMQCFCPTNGNSGPTAAEAGIQTNWLNTEMAGLSETQINEFKSQGWMFEQSGLGWNLLDDPYLAENRNFSCTAPTPTVVISPSTGPTPEIFTPTNGPEGPTSKCYDLEALPSEGTAPLTVKFIGHADDPATNGLIKQYRFDYADSSGNQPQVVTQTDKEAYHRYELSGNYTATLRIQDNAGNWRESDDCKVTIKVNSAPQVLGASTAAVLPSTGTGELVSASLILLVIGGIIVYRQFRIV